MATTIPIMAERGVWLKPAYIYEFIGKGNLYSYQTIGKGNLILEVSNDRKNWITLLTVEGEESVVLEHSWRYQRVTNTTDLTIILNRN